MVTEILTALESTAVILGLIGGVFSFTVLRPLYTVISELKQAIVELRADMKRHENRYFEINLKLKELEQSLKEAHEKIKFIADVCEISNVKRRGDNK